MGHDPRGATATGRRRSRASSVSWRRCPGSMGHRRPPAAGIHRRRAGGMLRAEAAPRRYGRAETAVRATGGARPRGRPPPRRATRGEARIGLSTPRPRQPRLDDARPRPLSRGGLPRRPRPGRLPGALPAGRGLHGDGPRVGAHGLPDAGPIPAITLTHGPQWPVVDHGWRRARGLRRPEPRSALAIRHRIGLVRPSSEPSSGPDQPLRSAHDRYGRSARDRQTPRPSKRTRPGLRSPRDR